MRSCGTAALLSHAGAPVPASSARLPRLRAVAVRIGASDAEGKGHSTFMREMIDTAAILRVSTTPSRNTLTNEKKY